MKPGAALSWKPNCQGCGASLNIVFKNDIFYNINFILPLTGIIIDLRF